MRAVQEQKAPAEVRPREVHIVAHSMLFYWWPVWVVGLWLVVVLFFDRQLYMVFAPGQLRVRQEIGSGEVAYDTLGMV